MRTEQSVDSKRRHHMSPMDMSAIIMVFVIVSIGLIGLIEPSHSTSSLEVHIPLDKGEGTCPSNSYACDVLELPRSPKGTRAFYDWGGSMSIYPESGRPIQVSVPNLAIAQWNGETLNVQERFGYAGCGPDPNTMIPYVIPIDYNDPSSLDYQFKSSDSTSWTYLDVPDHNYIPLKYPDSFDGITDPILSVDPSYYKRNHLKLVRKGIKIESLNKDSFGEIPTDYSSSNGSFLIPNRKHVSNNDGVWHGSTTVVHNAYDTGSNADHVVIPVCGGTSNYDGEGGELTN